MACRELHPKANTSGQALPDSEQRYMAVAAWLQPAADSVGPSQRSGDPGSSQTADAQPADDAQAACAQQVSGQHSTGAHAHRRGSAACKQDGGTVDRQLSEPLPGGCCLVLVASSDAKLQLLRLDMSARRWAAVCHLGFHLSPLLSLHHMQHAAAHCQHDEPQHSPGGAKHLTISESIAGCSRDLQLAFSGGTDGSVALWDLTCASKAQLQSEHLQPIWGQHGWHQSGVNALTSSAGAAFDLASAGTYTPHLVTSNAIY